MRCAPSTGCLVGLLSVFAVACDDSPCPDVCVEEYVTLTQGIYGQVLEVDDVRRDDECAQAYPASHPVWLETVDGVHVVEDMSDERGVFELVAPGGQYKPCVRDGNNHIRCASSATVTVPTSGRVRYDISSGVLAPVYARMRPASACGD